MFGQIHNKAFTSLLLMDLRKAFIQYHKNFAKKLSHYGIRGPGHDLIESYLTSWQQLISIKNCHSSTNRINIGVSQNSVLGPLLFLIYVNDFPIFLFLPTKMILKLTSTFNAITSQYLVVILQNISE